MSDLAVPTKPRRGRIPSWVTPAALLFVSLGAVLGSIWGGLFANPAIQAFEHDAGPVDQFEIGEVTAYEELEFFIVGRADGRLRAIDGRVRSNGCVVAWHPEDPRGVDQNPLGRTGAFVDPCSGAAWSMEGNLLASPVTPEPLRTFELAFKTLESGRQHVFVEVLGRERPAP
jgi:hypothetical protein